MPDRTPALGAGHPMPGIASTPEPYIIRPQVQHIFDAEHRMTVLRAPVGFGKTAALTAWLRTSGTRRRTAPAPAPADRSLVWHALTAPPASSASFWASLAADLAAVLTAGGSAETYDDVRALIATLDAPLLLVIDGLEATASTPLANPSPVGAIVTEIIDLLHVSQHLDVIISCRPYGPLAMDALFGHAAQILDGAAFALDEVATVELATAVGVPLTLDQAHELQDMFWGWPALTNAVLRELAASGASYDDTSWQIALKCLDVLYSSRVDLEVSHFIRQVSILNPLTGPLADRLTGSRFAGRMLDDLERAGLCRSQLHDGERHYTLLPAIVRAVLIHLETTAELASAHRHAAKMFRNLPEHTLHHAVLGQDWDAVLTIAEEQVVPLVLNHPRALLEALTSVPAGRLDAHLGLNRLRRVLAHFDDNSGCAPSNEPASPPTLARAATLATAQILALRACHQDVAAYDLVVERSPELLRATAEATSGSAVPLFQLHAGIARCLVGDVAAAIEDFEGCFNRVAGTELTFLARAAAEYSALAQAMLGNLSEARRTLDRSRTFTRTMTSLEFVDDRLDLLVDALIALDELDLKTARQLLPPPRDPQLLDIPPSWFLNECIRAHLHVLGGDHFSATAGLSRVLRDRRESLVGGTLSTWLLTATAATIDVWGGDATRARNFLDILPSRDLINAVQADVALQVGDVDAALAIADHALTQEYLPDRLRVEMLLARTVARARQSDLRGATTDLREAIALADPLLLRPFAAVPRSLLTELAPQVPEVNAVLARLADSGVTLTLVEHGTIVALATGERELLRVLAAGATVEEAAASLGVPVAVAQDEAEGLFRSLGVRDRLGALAAGHMLGYLDVPGP